jgi:DNA-binding LacI/PurR family transcriptional regulator
VPEYVTIRDVARAAEVSTATVSNVLNGTGRASPATRRHVRAVAAALGYAPHPAARHLRTGQARTLGLAVTTYGAEPWNFAGVAYYAEVIAAATATAHAHGYALTVLPTVLGDHHWRALGVDGVLLVDSPADDPVLDTLRRRGLPLAFDGRPATSRPGEVWVDNDHVATVREVLAHLTAGGARRPALVAGPSDDHYTRTCGAAYREWCAERAVAPLIAPISAADPEGVGAVESLLDAADSADAIYGIYDGVGRAALAVAARRGLRVPDDLLVVCASENPAYATTDPPVSTVSLSPRTTVERAVTALVDLVERRPAAVPPVIPTHLHVRRSSRRRIRDG